MSSRLSVLERAIHAEDPDERDRHAREYAQLTVAALTLDDDRREVRTDGGIATVDDDSDDELPEPVRVSDHAEVRWRQRADAPLAARVAWFESTTLDVDDPDVRADELRYHEPTSMVFFRNDDTLTTVVDAHDARSSIVAAVAVAGGANA